MCARHGCVVAGGARTVVAYVKEESMASRRPTDPSRPAAAAATSPRTQSRRKGATPQPRSSLSEEARRELIAVGAYLRAERRAFAPGHTEEDWLAAEAEVDALLRVSPRGPSQ
jgi:hypothetical protein